MLLICSKCGAEYTINPENTEATYILDKYNDIDTITGRSIEIRCACKNTLQRPEDIIIDYIIHQCLCSRPYEHGPENIQE